MLAEVSVGSGSSRLCSAMSESRKPGTDAARPQELVRASPESLSRFFETDPLGAVAGYALGTLTFFAIALLLGRLRRACLPSSA